MNEENDTGKHEFNFFLDRQIQQKLLEADEIIAAKETALYKNQLTNGRVQVPPNSSNSVVTLNSSNVVGTSKSSSQKAVKDSSRANISGWCSGTGVVYRKTESDVPSRARGQQGLRDALSRDSRFRPQTHNPQDFVFRHYSDPRKYIEQYRKEHSCYDTTTTSATRNEFLDTRRFYAYNQYSPLAVGAQSNASGLNSSLPSSYQEPAASTPDQTFFNQKKQHQQQAPTLQYTNRREQTKQTISANLRPSNLQKLSKSNTTHSDKAKTPDQLQEFISGHDQNGQQKRSGSARGSASSGVNGVTLQRNSTASDLDRLSARGQRTPTLGTALDSTSSNQFLGRKLGQVTSGQTRTLDALACHAPIGGKQISGDSQTAGQAATAWPCPEVRLEHFRVGRGRRGPRRDLVQPAVTMVTAPQPLAFIREGDEARSSWAQTSANSKGNNSAARDDGMSEGGNARGLPDGSSKGGDLAGSDDQMTGIAVLGISVDVVGDGVGGGESGGGGGSSNGSSLQPNGGSSVRTSISSYNSSSSTSSKGTKNKLRKLGRAKSEERSKSRHDTDQPTAGEVCSHVKPTAASTSSITTRPPASNTQGALHSSWRERVAQQHKKTISMSSTGDITGGDPSYLTSSRWAVARRHEELSSVAHARRIKNLIEQSRQKGGTGLALTRSVSEESGKGARGFEQDALCVEGQQHAHLTYNHSLSVTATSGLTPSKGGKSEGEEVPRASGLFPSSHPVLPPVRKGRGGGDTDASPAAAGTITTGETPSQHKQRAPPPEKPVLGDLLDAQSFFSHGISLSSTGGGGKKHHHHSHHHQRFTPPDKEKHLSSLGAKHASLPRTLGPTGATSRITLATAAIIGDPPQPRLKYTAGFQHKLTGSCLP